LPPATAPPTGGLVTTPISPSQLATTSGNVDMNVGKDNHHLLCPPKALIECMFPDTFVFPASLFRDARQTTFSIQHLFDTFCAQGLYSQTNRTWTSLLQAPDFKASHSKGTEKALATFLENIVERTVRHIGADPREARTWSAQDDKGLAGFFQTRKPDIIVKGKDAPTDWRFVDCVVEIKSRTAERSKIEREFLAQIAERARTLFSVQDTRRYDYALDLDFVYWT